MIGYVATRWGLDHFINGVQLENLAQEDFAWQEGWEYRISLTKHRLPARPGGHRAAGRGK